MRRPSSYRLSVIFCAVVSDQIEQVIEFFRTPAEAEAMLETVLEDEPDWRETLYIECVELVTGAELARRRRSAARPEALRPLAPDPELPRSTGFPLGLLRAGKVLDVAARCLLRMPDPTPESPEWTHGSTA